MPISALSARAALRAGGAGAAAALLLALSWGCGKKGPPLPPLRSYPERVSSLTSRQIGDRVVLSFPRPRLRTDGEPLGPDAAIEILMAAREPAPKRAADIELDPDVSWLVPASEWEAYAQGRRLVVGLRLGRMASMARLPTGARGLASRKLSFIVLVIEGRRKRSEPSDTETFAVCDPPPPPEGAAGRLAEQGIHLTWRAGGGARPGGALFHVYRHEEGALRPEAPLHPSPLKTSEYLDGAAVPGTRYSYAVRAALPAGRCESDDSHAVAATLVDLFPPSAPQGLAVVAEHGGIRLFWRPNREPDLRGYRIYRAKGEDGPWRLLTLEDLTTTSYTDEDVAPGVVYSYAVTARDGASPPNESLFSDPAAERTEAQE